MSYLSASLLLVGSHAAENYWKEPDFEQVERRMESSETLGIRKLY